MSVEAPPRHPSPRAIPNDKERNQPMNPTTEHAERTDLAATEPMREAFPSKRSAVRRMTELLVDTVPGPVILWWIAAGASLVGTFASFFPWAGAHIAYRAALCLLVAATVAAFAIWCRVLARRRWRQAAVQFVLGLVSAPIFVVGFAATFVVGASLAKATTYAGATYGGGRTAAVPDGTNGTAFAVEYVPAHPFLAEYRRTVVFPSGKRLGIMMDTGGAGPFAVYRLPSGAYFLVDGLDFDFVRSDYRVSPDGETVEKMTESRWIPLPDGTIAVTGGSSDSIVVETKAGEQIVRGGEPVGDSLLGRVYLGLLRPNGRFEPGSGGDPYATKVDHPWTAATLPAGIPFRFERREGHGRSARIVFPSGRTLPLPEFDGKDWKSFSLESGKFIFAGTGLMAETYRLDPVSGVAEQLFKDRWIVLPDSDEELAGIGLSLPRTPGEEPRAHASVRNADGTYSSMETESSPVGDDLAVRTFLGTIHPDGSFSLAAPPSSTPSPAEEPNAKSAESVE